MLPGSRLGRFHPSGSDRGSDRGSGSRSDSGSGSDRGRGQWTATAIGAATAGSGGADHARAPRKPAHRPHHRPEGRRRSPRDRPEGAPAAHLPRRPGGAIRHLGCRQPLGGTRSIRSRSDPAPADRLCLRQGGRHPPPPPGRSGSGRRRARPISSRSLRPGTRQDLAAAAPEGVSGLPPSALATTLRPPLSLTLPPAAVPGPCRCRCHGLRRTAGCSIGHRPLGRPTSQRSPTQAPLTFPRGSL